MDSNSQHGTDWLLAVTLTSFHLPQSVFLVQHEKDNEQNTHLAGG